MKTLKTIAISILFCSSMGMSAKIGIETNTLNASAALDVSSTTKGILIPIMSTTQRNAISTLAAGLLVYDTDFSQIWVYNGTSWMPSAGATKFVNGATTTDAVYTTGNGGIDSAAPSSSLLSVTCVQSGSWNNPATWSTNSVPTSADDVSIGMGFTVTLSGTTTANSIEVMGTLKPLTTATNFDITTKGIGVMGTGASLEIGTATAPYTGKCTITLTGTTTTETLFSSMPGMGTKLIGAMDGATINMHGIDKKSWTNLNVNAAIGATQITLKEPVGWLVGDEIVIVSSRANWNEAEKRTITAVSADAMTISFTSPLLYPHCGMQKSYTRATDNKTWSADLRAEVGLLSHNIKIEGDAASATNGFGGHIMVMNNSFGYVNNVELYRMGQKSKQARYPFHWHMLANTGTGQYFKNSSVNTSYNRAIVIHGTSNTTVENNFCYDHIGHGIFLENGSEINNLIKGNVVLLTRLPAVGEALTPSDNQFNQRQNQSPSSYWITNPNNTFINNVAAGTIGTGFWYALAQNFMFESLTDPRFATQTKPYKEVLGVFDGNKAHSCSNGFDIFDQLDATHSIVINGAWDENSLKYFTNNTWYANSLGIYTGIGGGRALSSKVIFKDNIFVENTYATMFASYSIVDESVFVANSGENLINGERSLYVTYDGAGSVKNSHFVGWDTSNSNFLNNAGAALKHANATFENITTTSNGPIRASSPNYNRQNSNYFYNTFHPSISCLVLNDKTGSITGLANASIISNFPMLTVGDEATFSNWTNLYYTPRRYVHSRISMGVSNPPNISVTRTKANTPTAQFYDRFGATFNYHQMSIIVNDNFIYTYQFEQLPTSKLVNQTVYDASVGDSYISQYKDFGKLGGLTVTASTGTFTAYTSLAALQSGNNAGYFIEPLGNLYIKSIASTNDQSYSIIWTTNFVVPSLDTDGDGYVDSLEASNNRVPTEAYDLRFTFNQTTDNWISDGTISSTCVACNGAWQINANGTDAHIIRDNLNFDANKVPTILADINSNSIGFFKLYWTTESEPFYSEDKVVVAYYNNALQRKMLAFSLANHPKWQNNTIKTLKFKTPDGATSTTIYTINSGTTDTDGDGISDDEEVLICKDPMNAADFSINFDSSYDATATWLTSSIDNFAVNNGILSGNSLGDAYFYKNNYNFNGSLVPKIKIRIKASAASAVQLFWANEDGGFGGGRASNFLNITTPGAWQELTFDLSNNANWMGKTIRTLRIDPVASGNISFEIDWIRSLNYTDCSYCQSSTTAVPILENNNWTYYGRAGSTDYLFAIEHKPTAGNSLTFNAVISLTKSCDVNNTVYNISNTTTKEGMFIAGYYWNIVVNGALNGFVNMRFFPDAILNASLETTSTTFFNTAGSNQQSPLLYFKTNNLLNLPNDMRSDAKGINYGFSPLLVNDTGTYASKNYVQFNQVSNINNSGGGLLKRVTNLDQNSFLTPSQAEQLKGNLRYNRTNDKFEGFNGSTWIPLH